MKKQMTAKQNMKTPGALSLRAPHLSLCLLGTLAFAGCDSAQDSNVAEQNKVAQTEASDSQDQAQFRRARVQARQSRRSGMRLPRWFFSQITPHVTCVETLENGQLRARWGYTNHTESPLLIPRGWWNGVAPEPALRPLQPRLFKPGRHEDVFRTTFVPSDVPMTWWLMWNTAQASEDSPSCEQEDLCEDVQCNDDDPCTMDECQPSDGSCVFVPKEDGMDCEVNGDAGVCEQGQCQVNGCQSDEDCQDSNVCNGVEVCGVDGVCVPSPALNCDDDNPCTEDACDPEAGCSNTAANENQECQGPDGSGICQAGLCEEIQLYTAGHGGLGFELLFDEVNGEFEPHIHVEGGTVNGQVLDDEEFEFDEIAIVTDAPLTRPTDDGGAFAGLCAEPGETIKWLPQSGTEADQLGVPFFGIEAEEIEAGLLVNDRMELSLVNVESPDGSGEYSIWNIPTLEPSFVMSSCDGINDEDMITVPVNGHAHYNMGFAKGGNGLWKVTYQVRGVLAADNTERSSTFTVNYLVR